MKKKLKPKRNEMIYQNIKITFDVIEKNRSALLDKRLMTGLK